jgi:hypothetical protein
MRFFWFLLFLNNIAFAQFSTYRIADKRFPIPLIAQKSESFCWAASMEMLLGDATINQCSIIKKHFTAFNCSCTPCPATNDAGRCPSYALTFGVQDLKNTILGKYGLKGTILSHTPSKKNWSRLIKDNLDNQNKHKKHIFLAQIQFDDSDCAYENTGHIVVVNGYHASSTKQHKALKSWEVDKYLYLQDPYPTCSGNSAHYTLYNYSTTPTLPQVQEKICYFLLDIEGIDTKKKEKKEANSPKIGAINDVNPPNWDNAIFQTLSSRGLRKLQKSSAYRFIPVRYLDAKKLQQARSLEAFTTENCVLDEKIAVYDIVSSKNGNVSRSQYIKNKWHTIKIFKPEIPLLVCDTMLIPTLTEIERYTKPFATKSTIEPYEKISFPRLGYDFFHCITTKRANIYIPIEDYPTLNVTKGNYYPENEILQKINQYFYINHPLLTFYQSQ